ncbi:hypothetical protein BD309DRAFT_622819 [Dichomitus squalens]|uniref:Uncharacterized protein n=1 Tax=Dichomitus squalens TaxID=114155 RepID=A0A4Q9NX16_9APHY|nr:hypothetical protein BD309DRAFT_622819 [Dichomitus squalens]TBU63293.1 hypothetical protein BD310DRAFT_626278 [Dichomitus squalens]
MQLTHFVPIHHLGSPAERNHLLQNAPESILLHLHIAAWCEDCAQAASPLHAAFGQCRPSDICAGESVLWCACGACPPCASDDTYLLRIRTLAEEVDSVSPLFARFVPCSPPTRADGRGLISSVSPPRFEMKRNWPAPASVLAHCVLIRMLTVAATLLAK